MSDPKNTGKIFIVDGIPHPEKRTTTPAKPEARIPKRTRFPIRSFSDLALVFTIIGLPLSIFFWWTS